MLFHGLSIKLKIIDDMKDNKYSVFIKKYFCNIILYRMIIAFLFLIVTLIDLYKVVFIHCRLYMKQGMGNCDILREALVEQIIIIAIYMFIVLLYAWKFRSNKFFTRYLKAIDVIILLYIFYMIYLLFFSY